MVDLTEVKERLERAASWTAEWSDSRGKCDDCHSYLPLWLDRDTEGAGDFSYCGGCWSGRMNALVRRLKDNA